ncbi:MAG: hypothetical protein ACKODH_13880 [Limisphaerales bacterium]
MKKCLGPLLALALALTGCIEFERQTVTYEHDAKADTLRIHQTYHGIYGADDVTQLSEKEREQLAEVMSGQRTFFFNNWISEINIERLKETLAEEAAPKTNSLNEAARRATTNLVTLLIANVRIENGKFYLNEQGQPCGTQRVTVRNVCKVIEAGNALVRRALEVEMKKNDDAAERELMNASLARPEPFITLTGQQIRIRFPQPREEFNKVGDESAKTKQFINEFIRAGGTLAHENGEVHVRFGRVDAARESVTLPMPGLESYRGNAAGHLRQNYGLATGFDPKRDLAEFLSAKSAGPQK